MRQGRDGALSGSAAALTVLQRETRALLAALDGYR